MGEIDLLKHTIKRDTREQSRGGRWSFDNMVEEKLDSGDYTLLNYEKIVVIERKASVAEISMNVFEQRFERELIRLEEFKYPFIICEFEWSDLVLFPTTSNIPKYIWPKLKVNAGILIKKVAEWSLKYKTRIMFAGGFGKAMAETIFKRVLELS